MGINFSHILGIVWINASHEIWKKPIALECLCFPICFPFYENSVFPCYRNYMAFYFMQNRGVWNKKKCFLITFLHYQKSLSPCVGENTTDVKTNEKFLFLIPFPHNIYVKFFTKEVNLFCS